MENLDSIALISDIQIIQGKIGDKVDDVPADNIFFRDLLQKGQSPHINVNDNAGIAGMNGAEKMFRHVLHMRPIRISILRTAEIYGFHPVKASREKPESATRLIHRVRGSGGIWLAEYSLSDFTLWQSRMMYIFRAFCA
jgi:hypothetical protein